MRTRSSLSVVVTSAAMLAVACIFGSAEPAFPQFITGGSMGGMQAPPPPPAEVVRRLEHPNVSVRLRGAKELRNSVPRPPRSCRS